MDLVLVGHVQRLRWVGDLGWSHFGLPRSLQTTDISRCLVAMGITLPWAVKVISMCGVEPLIRPDNMGIASKVFVDSKDECRNDQRIAERLDSFNYRTAPRTTEGLARWKMSWSGEVVKFTGWCFVFKIWNCVIPISNSYFHLIGFFEYDQVLLHDTPDRNWSHYIIYIYSIHIWNCLPSQLIIATGDTHLFEDLWPPEKSDVKPLDSIDNRYLKAVQKQVTFPILACDVAAGDSHVAAVCWTGAV